MGTIGGGNHFAEFQAIDEIYNQAALDELGLSKKHLQLLVHSGSRGLGQSILVEHIAGHNHDGLCESEADFKDYMSKHDEAVTFQTCRASGAGGQHVNTTDSAVRATHTATGISVRVESERSQHANKRLARVLLFQKLEQLALEKMTQQETVRWQQHWEVERGNPVKTFIGEKFALNHDSSVNKGVHN